jgi:hypothetical protein
VFGLGLSSKLYGRMEYHTMISQSSSVIRHIEVTNVT